MFHEQGVVAELGGKLGSGRCVDIGEHRLGAFTHEATGVFRTHALCRAGDNRHLAFQSLHYALQNRRFIAKYMNYVHDTSYFGNMTYKNRRKIF